MSAGTFVKHREYKFFGEYQDIEEFQAAWEEAFHEYHNALIDGDRKAMSDAWDCMIEADSNALIMIEQIEDYLEKEAA